jgi:hypothetical protein
VEKKCNLKYNKCLTGLAGILWITGLLIAGSDSPYMPWVNGLGLILFFCASIVIGKLFQPVDIDVDQCNDNKLPLKLTRRPLLCLKIGFSE